jgi:hypothetical protein
MAAPTLATMIGNVRALIYDTRVANDKGLLDSQIAMFINTGLLWWYENNEKRVKRATLVTTWTAGVREFDGDATCLYPEILMFFVAVGGDDRQLIPMKWGENFGRDVLTDTPSHISSLKLGGAGVGAAAQNKWRFATYPTPAAQSTITGIVRDYPVQLSADADIVDLGDYEARCVEIIAAILAAPRIGRPDLAQDLTAMLPKLIQDKLATHRMRDEVNA